MNPVSSLYASLYSSRIKEGYPPSTDPHSANIVIACCMTMLFISIGLLIFFITPELFDFNRKWIKSGKQIGQLLAILIIVVVYPIIRNTIGTKSNYDKIINKYNEMSPEEQVATTKKGTLFMILSLSSIAIPMILGLLID